MNVFPFIANVENGWFETSSFAIFADEFDIGQELHLHSYGPVPFASFTAPARNVEGKMAGTKGLGFGLPSGRKYLTNASKALM